MDQQINHRSIQLDEQSQSCFVITSRRQWQPTWYSRGAVHTEGIVDNWEIQSSSWLPSLVSALQRQVSLQLDAQKISANSSSVLPEADEQAGVDSAGRSVAAYRWKSIRATTYFSQSNIRALRAS
ncbi:hypothetical protein [Bradyrhizobium sp. NBAIM01]|uniref:hypothetical protein n=1 Tax=Bradyrhizobium sp. NBAIM01 TaxID=2793818 RepID=UPI001CD70694|nr:hypothetical protein [Bradyrhizobium sp. NBAIM01]MCA1512720.1 hypothetical protein [Bradyrhizobium sp. NBAIM01]